MALKVLILQPEVDPNILNILGHSEGTLYAPRVAIDNSTMVNHVILMAALAQNPVNVVEYATDVSLPLEYSMKVLDQNHTGLIQIQQIANAPVLFKFLPLSHSLLRTNNTESITAAIAKVFDTNRGGYISNDKQLKPILVKKYENTTSFVPSNDCALIPSEIGICPILWGSLFNMIPNLSTIGNISNSTGIQILQGENDSDSRSRSISLAAKINRCEPF